MCLCHTLTLTHTRTHTHTHTHKHTHTRARACTQPRTKYTHKEAGEVGRLTVHCYFCDPCRGRRHQSCHFRVFWPPGTCWQAPEPPSSWGLLVACSAACFTHRVTHLSATKTSYMGPHTKAAKSNKWQTVAVSLTHWSITFVVNFNPAAKKHREDF